MRVGIAVRTGRRRPATWGLVGRTAACGALVAAGLAGCGDGATDLSRNAVRLNVSPGDGGDRLRPDSAIQVAAEKGTVENVTVTHKGQPVEGELSADRTHWKSRWTLDPGTDYSVTATALGRDGRTRTVTSGFSTAKVSKTIDGSLEGPFDKETVGVGIPIVVKFEQNVGDRAAVERAMDVKADKPVQGAWHWFDNQTLVFRTREYWPAHTKVSFQAHLSGVHAGKGLWGARDVKADFRVGDSHITKASATTHMMYVRRNGKLVRTIPVSMGRGGEEKYTTTNGAHLTMEKEDPVIMDSSTTGCGPGCPGYYRETVYAAVRISNSGEYVHSAPWSVGDQGNSNVSHGCVNASPEDARWFYNFSYRGDPVRITGTSRELEPDNGWGFWQLPWDKWVAGSALKQAVSVSPQGSSPVAPDSAPPSTQAGPSQAPPTPSAAPTAQGAARPGH
ncbi:L,D-transpeptidase [Actinomadura rupiterrae]|uniref:L,D-transpeptidase n=1 Tax=Actinomadura rupiterrae TaxID=559627 RepID=UPI0020A2FE2B|nr:Ig-like domain-containing protein [Actinomadura rupiterrae]MCP2338507.1 lipoprotein-anchoring transpeptidase ErfK/SrfK [Actinomadura rupiterrae]